jgi:hypothetical protein
MYLQKKFRFGLLAILAALSISALPLSAQQVYKATFDLPFSAHWGRTVLEPGEYTVTVEQGLAMRLIRIQGEGGTAVTVAGPYKTEPAGEYGRLTFANVGGTYVLEQFDAGSLGQAFTFGKPKSPLGEAAHAGEKTRDTVVLATH